MTTPARQAEAEEASAVFQLALTQIGVSTVEDAIALWADVPVTSRAPTAASWLRRAITLVMTRRRMSRDLARSYYRLVRALRTGTTVADPYHPEPTYITLDVLRREFAELAGTAGRPLEGRSEDQPAGTSDPSDQVASSDPAPPDDVWDGTSDQESADDPDRILVEELEGLREAEEQIERAAEQELRTVLEALGLANLERKVDAIDHDRPARDVDALREEAHLQAGAQQAAAAQRVAMNGGRSAVWNHMQRDRRAVGYIRLSRTGTPCGWCAMLISRGPVYKSQRSAEFADGDAYHDNCHCYAEPVYSRAQYGDSALYELNRRYQELWPKVTRGLSGTAAVSAWRRFIRQEQKAAAQEARRSTSAQEA
ncbi:hypothetical protein [Streptodolium elevatio]|uniref:Capsid maturation protease n=1 Tax=Streptodolium elevatio TaxID=3157996 RepID=A0ABV3DBY5_9ACTN